MFFRILGGKEKKKHKKIVKKNNPDITINCRVDMNMKLSGLVEIGPNGLFYGNLAAKQVVVKGKVFGTILAADKVILKNTAHVNGKIIAKSLAVDETANGKIDLNISKHNSFSDLEESYLGNMADEEELKSLLDVKKDGNSTQNNEASSKNREFETDSINTSKEEKLQSKQKHDFW